MIERSAKNAGVGKRAANGRSTIIRRPDGRWHGWVSMGLLRSGKPDRRHVSAKTQSGAAAKVRALERARGGQHHGNGKYPARCIPRGVDQP